MRKFETVETKQDAADLKDVVRATLFPCLFGCCCFVVVLWSAGADPTTMRVKVMNKFYGKMQEYKEEKEPLPQDLQQGAEEDEWSD